MKIVINAFSARMGGGQTYVRNLLARLPDDQDLRILVFAPADLDLAEDPRITRGATSMQVDNQFKRLVWEGTVLPRELKAFGADVLFCPGGLLNSPAPEGCVRVTMFRNMLPFDKRALARLAWGKQKVRNLLLRRQMLSSMKKADLTIFISDFARKHIESLQTMPRAVTIPHGINAQFLASDKDLPVPAQAGGRDYILYVSRFEPYKHHFEIVQAYARLSPEIRENYLLLLVGETNYAGEFEFEEAQRVAVFIKEQGLGNDVVMTGGLPYADLPAFYRNASAILFASSCENCPNILLESLGAGRPTLSSDVQPMPEFGGPDLCYFSPFDAADIKQKLEHVLSDDAYADGLAKAAAERAGHYDWDVTARRTWDAIYDVAGSTLSSAKA